MGKDQPVLRPLFACESGLSQPEIELEQLWIWPELLVAPRVRRALGTRMIWQKKNDKWQN
jgi:hypothetical protein